MPRNSGLLSSTVGKKLVVGVTGVFLIGFLVFHLLGNLSLFRGQEAFNNYAHTLESIPGSMFGELGFAALFLVHIGFTLNLAMANRQARPEGYQVDQAPTHFASRWMPVSGLIVMAFLVVHLLNLRFGPRWETPGGLYELTMKTLGNPLFGGLYIVGVCLLFFHLSHGIQAVFRTLGYTDKAKYPHIQLFARVLSAVLALGFISMPLYALLK